MLVKDIMTQNVITVGADELLSKAAELMGQYDIGILPVIDDTRLVGVITDRDIVTRAVAKKLDPECKKVCDCMSKSTVCANPTQQVGQVAKIMASQQIRRVPITENGCLCGILSLGDISKNGYQTEIAAAICEISRP